MCKRCSNIWINDEGEFSTTCPVCDSHHICHITNKQARTWLYMDIDNEKFLTINFNLDKPWSNPVFTYHLLNGSFDGLPWADKAKKISMRNGGGDVLAR